MNYELKYIDNDFIPATGESRRIKLRKLSFTNVSNMWKSIINSFASSFSNTEDIEADNDYNSNDNEINNDADKLEINIGNLNSEIFIVNTNYIEVETLKRRVLAISAEMYNNINNNINKVFNDQSETSNVNVDENEIRQAVKDAFDQIEFDKPVSSDVVITPEEVSNTVVSSENEVEEQPIEENKEEYSTDESNVNQTTDQAIFDSFDSYESEDESSIDNSEYSDTKPLFNFEDINFDSINIDNNIEDYNNDTSIEEDYTSPELDDILLEAKELKSKKDEQDKKTEAAKNLANEKEAEKEKIKADFMAYKNSLEEELNKSKQLEQENLERARKAEEFSAALSDIME